MQEQQVVGCVDLHIHSAPDIFPRSVTSLAAARQAQEAGMLAIVLKSHSTDTAARAEMVRELTGFPVFGGVCLNYSVGGMNPYAVLETARQGGRCVWMPSINAANFLPRAHTAPMLAAAIPPGVPGLVAAREGRLLPEVGQILDLIAEHGLLLCGGHLAAEETKVLLTEAHRRGIERVLVNHAEVDFMGFDLEDIKALADLGAFIEVTKAHSAAERAALIREIGVERCVVATDAGPTSSPVPVELLGDLLGGLADQGFTPADLRYMSSALPAWLLQLEGHGERPTLG